MYRKPIGTLVAVALYLGMASLCPGAIEPVTSVTCDNPDGAIPYNLLSITVGRYTVGVDDLRRALALAIGPQAIADVDQSAGGELLRATA